MPLEFQSLSHGPVAFGFINIETDLLILEHYFLFASDFCRYICDLAKEQKGSPGKVWTVRNFTRREEIGDLMAAIHGIRYIGFIGEVYKVFPFPSSPEDFKQNPEGYRTRSTVEGIIQQFATEIAVPVVVDQSEDRISIGECVFRKGAFQELLLYVWRGGYPRWKGEVRPEYVHQMKEAIEQSKDALFQGLVFTS